MKTISVLQNTDAEHLGLVEDHLEGRNIRFRYIRPAHDSNWASNLSQTKDGLILLGAAPFGTFSSPNLPLLEQRVRIVKDCLDQRIPILAFGTGTQLLVLAAGGSVESRELSLEIQTARRIDGQALNGHLPEEFPVVTYMRDFPILVDDVRVLAVTERDETALFQMNNNCLGFIGHPGIKSAMIEDSIVQLPALNDLDLDALETIRTRQSDIEQALVSMMTGVIQLTGWMQ